VLDKTGTITVGEPAVSEVVALHGAESGVLATAARAPKRSVNIRWPTLS